MGIFDFLKKEENKEEFSEIILKTENVPQTLLDISKKYDLPLSNLDFELLSYKTFVKMGDTDFVEADSETLKLIEHENFLIDEHNEIKQSYEIKVKKYRFEDDFEIIGEMKTNKNLTKAEFVVLKSSKLNIKNLKEKLIDEFNKKKLKNSLLINLCDKNMREDINKLVSLVLIEEGLSQDFKIELCKCIDPKPTIQGRVEYTYKKHKKEHENLYIYPIKKGETIIEIINPKPGTNGRNCKGEIIKAEPLLEFTIPDIAFDEKTIKKEENEDRIIFVSLKDGYVVKEDDKFEIKDQLELRQVNIKTGNIKGADESDVKMKINESDVLKEAVADGMVVESKELIIKGNVGNKSKVKAKTLKIEGQTHQNSKILAIEAEINVHKGYLKAKNVTINSLESGRIVADKVYVKRALGGEIVAKEIEIDMLLSHVKMYALKKIKVNVLKGEENLFCISPKKVLKDTDIKKLETELEEVRRDIRRVKEEALKIKKILLENKRGYLELKKTYEENKKRGVKNSPALITKLKKYQEINKKYLKFNEKIMNLKLKEEEILETIDNIQNALYNAKIINCSAWTPYNRIEFELLEPPVTLKYDTKDDGYCGFKLRFFEFPKIVKIKVDNDCGS
ncbi:flagellar assembly protein A [Caminibacter pacificus]